MRTMTFAESRSAPEILPWREAQLRVERTDISFENAPGNQVQIQVRVTNDGDVRSPRTSMRLESAPFGAFVPWRPLTTLAVPPLEPGESRKVMVDVPRPNTVPLGDFDRVPPRELIGAVSAPFGPPPQSRMRDAAALLLRERQNARVTGGVMGAAFTALAPDLMALAGQAPHHWVGNINVFIGQHAVERHFAKSLRIYAGRANSAIFDVGGNGTCDAYAFELKGLNLDWKAVLFNLTDRQKLVIGPADKPVEETAWVESTGMMMAMLSLYPPANCGADNLEVHVTRRSRGDTAVVEFDFDPKAPGRGCFAA